MSKLTELSVEMSRLTREKREAIQNAYTWDNDLAPQHNQSLRQAAEKRVRDAYDGKLTELKERASDIAESAKAAGRRHRPALDRDDATAVANLSMEWANRVQPLLIAGKSLRSILEAGNVHTALAAEQYAPTWFQANRPNVDDHAFISRDITSRLAELAPSESAATAIRDAANVDNELAIFNSTTAYGETGDSLAAALGAAYANDDIATKPATAPSQEAATGLDAAVAANYVEA